MSEEMFYVYVDRRCSDDVPFYVGKGKSRRVRDRAPRNKRHRNIVAKYGMSRTVEFETLDELEAFQKERELIEEYHTFAFDEGSQGANFTRGGDGSSGHKWNHTDESRAKLHEAHQGRKKSDATKAKMKLAAKRRADDPLWIEKMRQVARERWERPEYREKLTGQKRPRKNANG